MADGSNGRLSGSGTGPPTMNIMNMKQWHNNQNNQSGPGQIIPDRLIDKQPQIRQKRISSSISDPPAGLGIFPPNQNTIPIPMNKDCLLPHITAWTPYITLQNFELIPIFTPMTGNEASINVPLYMAQIQTQPPGFPMPMPQCENHVFVPNAQEIGRKKTKKDANHTITQTNSKFKSGHKNLDKDRQGQLKNKSLDKDGQRQLKSKSLDEDGQRQLQNKNLDKDGQRQLQNKNFDKDGQRQLQNKNVDKDGQRQLQNKNLDKDGQRQLQKKNVDKDGQRQLQNKNFDKDGQRQLQNKNLDKDGQRQLNNKHRKISFQQKVHAPEKVLSCSICNGRFGCQQTLQQHELIHKVQQLYFSQQCFRPPGYVNVHKRKRSSGQKRHVCTSCSKTFSYAWTLRRHVEAHTCEKPYPCKFAGPSGLKNHPQSHHKDVLFTTSAKRNRKPQRPARIIRVNGRPVYVYKATIQEALEQTHPVDLSLRGNQNRMKPEKCLPISEFARNGN